MPQKRPIFSRGHGYARSSKKAYVPGKRPMFCRGYGRTQKRPEVLENNYVVEKRPIFLERELCSWKRHP